MGADSLINTSASPLPPHASSSSVHPFCLSLKTSMLLASQINMDIQKINKSHTHNHTVSSSWFAFLLFLLIWTSYTIHMPMLADTHALKDTQTHTCTQYPVLEMHGGRLLRRGKPSVNDSSCGKIMFLMQRWVRRWWRKMTFWMVKWVNVRSQPQRFPFDSPTINPSFFLLLSHLLCLFLSFRLLDCLLKRHEEAGDKRGKANAMICVSHAVQFVTIATLITI